VKLSWNKNKLLSEIRHNEDVEKYIHPTAACIVACRALIVHWPSTMLEIRSDANGTVRVDETAMS